MRLAFCGSKRGPVAAYVWAYLGKENCFVKLQMMCYVLVTKNPGVQGAKNLVSTTGFSYLCHEKNTYICGKAASGHDMPMAPTQDTLKSTFQSFCTLCALSSSRCTHSNQCQAGRLPQLDTSQDFQHLTDSVDHFIVAQVSSEAPLDT